VRVSHPRGNRPEANAQVGEDEQTRAHFSRFAKVYRAWGFYRDQLIEEAATTGLPVVRHLFIHYPDDLQVYTLSYQQFMVGSELMVAPVLDAGANHVRVYLPAGDWVHLWTETVYRSPVGRQITIVAPLGQPQCSTAAARGWRLSSSRGFETRAYWCRERSVNAGCS
jgi:alpha-glucosidase (family GH31 glycosyl hydrolase)